MRVIRVTFISLARWPGLGGPGGGVDGFLRLFAEALGATLAVRERARVLLIGATLAVRVRERVLPAGGAADGVDVTGVDFEACFAGGTTTPGNALG
jgi:hypothetical protein